MGFFLVWVVLCIIPAAIASSKGRNGFGWFGLSIVISPLLAGIIVACLPRQTKEIEQRAVSSGDMKKCPQCAELVKAEAKICRFCRFEFPAIDLTNLPVATSNPPERCPKCSYPYFHEAKDGTSTWICDTPPCETRFLVPHAEERPSPPTGIRVPSIPDRCPRCGSAVAATAGGIYHCNGCGSDFQVVDA